MLKTILFPDEQLHEIKIFLSENVDSEQVRRMIKELILRQRMTIKQNLGKFFPIYAEIYDGEPEGEGDNSLEKDALLKMMADALERARDKLSEFL
ncbi:MAG: hypothetical protein R6U39_01895 [Candidatus Aegiribacteria sp.]